MAYVGIFATEAELDAKAGKNVDATGWTEDNKTAWEAQAESYINLITRKNYSDTYTTLNDDVKKVLSEAASNLVAIYGIQYNMEGFTPYIVAQNMIKILKNRFNECINLLMDQNTLDFLESQT